MSREDQPTDPSTAGDAPGEARGFTPSSAVQGEIRVPGSKSIAQRLLVGSLLAHGTTEIEGLPPSDDVMHALRCARAAGATFPSEGRKDDLLATALLSRRGLGRLSGAPPSAREGSRPWCTLPVGESGTAARLFTAVCALSRPAGSGAEIIPSGSLTARSSPALFRALREAGVGVEHPGARLGEAQGAPANGWPVSLTAAEPPAVVELHDPTSSQDVSALLFALAAYPEERRLRVHGGTPSRGYIEVTRRVLQSFGVVVQSVDPAGSARAVEEFVVHGPLIAPTGPVQVEADASAAAVALSAGALSGGGRVWVPGVGTASVQPDAAIHRALAAFGVDTSGSTVDQLMAQGSPSRGAAIDCSGTPDLAPVLAAVAGYVARTVGEASQLTGLETLPGKESSRIEVLAEGLSAIGLSVHATDHSLRVGPSGARDDASRSSEAGRRHLRLDPRGDHRMAFAFALLSLFEPGVFVSNPGCVGKSWPRFWSALAASGAAEATL